MQTRPQRRRLARDEAKYVQYHKSGFIDTSYYICAVTKSSKYMPHIGKKELAKYKDD